MTNAELLESTVPNQLLSTIEQQERFILRQANMKSPCPNCGTQQNQFEAAGITVDAFDFKSPERSSHCISCKRELEKVVPLFAYGRAKWHWILLPIPK